MMTGFSHSLLLTQRMVHIDRFDKEELAKQSDQDTARCADFMSLSCHKFSSREINVS